jgi:di/tricarboxylate transporter
MPLAFGTILGGMATLLTTTNIVASGLLRDVGLRGFGLLEFAPFGLPLAFAGILFVVVFGRKFLPSQSPGEQIEKVVQGGEILLNTYQLADRLLRGRVRSKGYLDGKTLEESGLRQTYHLNVMAVQRGKLALPLEPKTRLKGNDTLLILARPEDTLPENLGELLEILPPGGWEEQYLSTPDMTLIEAAIAPRSALAGKTLQELRFEQKFAAKVLAVWRHGRPLRTRLASLPLEFGDGLLLQGTARSLTLLRTEPGLILLAESSPAPHMNLRGWLTAAIMVLTLILAVLFPNLIAEIMLGGAVTMVLIGALDMDQAYRAVEWRSLFLVAGMLPVGVALAKTGGAALLADSMVRLTSGSGSSALLAGFIFLTVILTQVINGSTAVAVVGPIAIAAAQRTGSDPRSFALTVALAASMAFMSPLGHPVNIMVMGAGGYTFRDYARLGIPLTICLGIILLILLSIVV